jgi:hypothetical protein
MIIKIKTFSGETLYLQEKDYLQELMFSNEEVQEETSSEKKKSKRSLGEKIALGVGATGAAVGAGSYGARQLLSHLYLKRRPYYDRNFIGRAKERRNYLGYIDSLTKDEAKEEDFTPSAIKAIRLGRAGVLVGTGLAIGGLGTAAYLRSRKRKKKEQEENSKDKTFSEEQQQETPSEKKKNKRSLGEKIALGVGSAGAVLGAGSYGARQLLAHVGEKARSPKYNNSNFIGKAKLRRGTLAYIDSLTKGQAKNEEDFTPRLMKAVKLGRTGVLAGTGLAIGGLGTAAYLRSRKRKEANMSEEEKLAEKKKRKKALKIAAGVGAVGAGLGIYDYIKHRNPSRLVDLVDDVGDVDIEDLVHQISANIKDDK